MSIAFHYLHGFLGLTTDWQKVTKKFNFPAYTYPLESFLPKVTTPQAFKSWVNSFHLHVGSLSQKHTSHILVGYSLGGRLALHSLCAQGPWTAAIIISAHPGLMHESEKQNRIKQDALWAKRFQTAAWEQVMEEWNAQAVFAQQKHALARNEKSFERIDLVQWLNLFSLGKQEDLRPHLKALNLPILWVAGQADSKFADIASEMGQLNPCIQPWICPRAGHRVPWENTNAFVERCHEFISFLTLN